LIARVSWRGGGGRGRLHGLALSVRGKFLNGGAAVRVDVVVIGGTRPWYALLVLLIVVLVGLVEGGLIAVGIMSLIVGPLLGWGLWKWHRAARFAQSHGWESANCALGYVEFFYLSGGRSSRGWARFTPMGGVVRGLPRPGEYALVASVDWIYGAAAGCRVEEGRYKGLILAVLDPAMAKSVSGELSISTPQGDYARAVVKPVGPGQVEAVVEAKLVEARAARLELVAKTSEKSHKVKLAESRGGVVREVVDLRGLAGPKVVIIAGTPNDEALDLFRNGVAGLGFGPTYALRLVLDVPQAGEVAVEERVVPTSF